MAVAEGFTGAITAPGEGHWPDGGEFLEQLGQNKLTGANFFSTYAETCRTAP
ncbi:hypothetical protein AB0O22_17900 [Streptomyces sp. NPDC091204]|uniref:hypothetical protein n=1 Tax=Streptomyces sp. NPDC091204 TaxID=3155299 RepID=UPI003449D54B